MRTIGGVFDLSCLWENLCFCWVYCHWQDKKIQHLLWCNVWQFFYFSLYKERPKPNNDPNRTFTILILFYLEEKMHPQKKAQVTRPAAMILKSSIEKVAISTLDKCMNKCCSCAQQPVVLWVQFCWWEKEEVTARTNISTCTLLKGVWKLGVTLL